MIRARNIQRLRYVYPGDAAIDKENVAFDWQRYCETFEDKYLPLKEGCTPTVFTLQPLTRKQFQHCIKVPNEEMAGETIAYGLVGLDGFERGGNPVVLKTKPSDLGPRLDAETLDRIFVPEVFADIAPRIMQLSQLDPTRG